MISRTDDELKTVNGDQVQLNIAGALRAIGAPNGCVIGAASKSFPQQYPVRPYLNSGYARIDEIGADCVGRICVFMYANCQDAAAAFLLIVKSDFLRQWIPRPYSVVEDIGDVCAVHVHDTSFSSRTTHISALLRVETVVIHTTFAADGDYRAYLKILADGMALFQMAPNVFEEAASLKVEELGSWFAIKCAELKEEELARQRDEVNQFYAKVDQLASQHIRALLTKKVQGIRQDDYGNVFDEKWVEEIRYFLSNVVERSHPLPVLLDNSESLLGLIQYIDKLVAKYQEDHEAEVDSSSELVEKMSPRDFEQFCAKILRKCGWSAIVTQASGDQGVDVIATRGNVKAVFQCKKYAQPVGNSAVQEIFAGKQFERADVAAVVSNATFTSSAKQLANAAGIQLLHYTELEHFAVRVGIE